VPRKSARAVAKALRSAIANAENNHDLRPESLVVVEAVAGKAKTYKSFRPKARGSAGPLLMRGSHIRIVVSDGKDEETGKN
jgi:large subunit ribosomal protein L22